jgi:DNA invertase Pin-like site-specific DNA recombinase
MSRVYQWRRGDGVLFVQAPNDEAHRRAFKEAAPGAAFDAVLKEWRVPWDGGKFGRMLDGVRVRARKYAEVAQEAPPAAEPSPAVSGFLFGYARVSTAEQNPEMQIDALRRAGVEDDRIFYEHVSGVKTNRAELANCLRALRRGDMLIVWRLDRLGRSLKELLDITHRLGEMGVHFRSLSEAIDTSTPAGRLLFHMMGAIAEFERNLARERTMAGLQAARERGKVGGRKPVLTAPKLVAARTLLGNAQMTAQEVADQLGVSRSTIYRSLKRADKAKKDQED